MSALTAGVVAMRVEAPAVDGVLVVGGVMWFGDRLREHFERACGPGQPADVLAALDTMRREIAEQGLADEQAAAALGARIQAAAGGGRTATRDLRLDMFETARRGQRDRAAAAIATALGDLGLRSADGSAPAVAVGNDVARVAARCAGREVTVDVSLDGDVLIDAGGEGAAAPDEVLAALRARGVVLLETVAGDDAAALRARRRALRRARGGG